MTEPRTASLAQTDIADAFLDACHGELNALKPGNVHTFAAGHDMDIVHFETAAAASAPIIADPALQVGARIKVAVTASLAATGCNTNLGILLLCVPLAAAAERNTPDAALQTRLKETLSELNQSDAEDIFAAIRDASPGGLGEVAQGDVRHPGANLGVLEAMRLSAGFDRIANAYVTDFDDLFSHHLGVLDSVLNLSPKGTKATDPHVVTTLYMRLLQDFTDSHIQRKFDAQTAHGVQAEAAALKSHWVTPEATQQAHEILLAFDRDLKHRGLNPGTTADFTVASLFADGLNRRFAAH